MSDRLFFEQLQSRFSAEFATLNSSFEAISVLYRNLPVNEQAKKQYLDGALKVKSAWYACLVNSNIDVLLLPEYLESKLSRNILIKKETEQYFRSFDNFNLHTVQNTAAIYDCILYNEDAEPKSSFDLFSSQAPESASCPKALKALYDSWSQKFHSFSPLETLVFECMDWHRFNGFSFSGQRQFVLWLNYRLWKLYGPIVQKTGIEYYLYQNWNQTLSNPAEALKQMLHHLIQEISVYTLELKEMYREQIRFDALKSRQKIVAGYLFENGFRSETSQQLLSAQAQSVLKLVLKKGFVSMNDFDDRAELDKHRNALTELTGIGILEADNEDGEICLYLNTTLKNKSGYLFKFQNLKSAENKLSVDDFMQQSPVKSIVPAEKISIPEPAVASAVKSRRQKAFFG